MAVWLTVDSTALYIMRNLLPHNVKIEVWRVSLPKCAKLVLIRLVGS